MIFSRPVYSPRIDQEVWLFSEGKGNDGSLCMMGAKVREGGGEDLFLLSLFRQEFLVSACLLLLHVPLGVFRHIAKSPLQYLHLQGSRQFLLDL